MSTPASGPWEQYSQEDGPWTKYADSNKSASSAPQPAPMSAPKLGDFIPDADTMGKAASGIASGIGGMASSLGSGAVGMVTHPLDTMAGALKSAGKSITDSYDLAKQGQIVPAAARAMSLVGFEEPKMAQEWNQGQGAHAAGEALPMSITDAMGAEKMAGRDLELPQMEKSQMPSMPKSSMPLVRGVFHDLANKYVGPRLANAILPEPTPEPTVQSLTESPNYQKIQAGRVLARRQAMNELSPKAPEPQLGSPENPGWHSPLPTKMPSITDPVAAAVKRGDAAMLPTRMPSVTDATTQAIREGRASAIPTRMPTPASVTDPVIEAVRQGIASKVPTTMPSVTAKVDPVVEAVRQGIASKVPTSMPAQPAEIDPVTAAIRRGDAARLPVRMPKGSIVSTAAEGPPAPQSITEPHVAHWQEGEAPQTRGSQAWSKQRVQSPELQRAAAAGDTDAQTVMMRLGKKGIIIPKPSIGSK